MRRVHVGSAPLGVSTLSYLPFCFFNVLSPVLSVLYGITGFKVESTEHYLDTRAQEATA